jgi:beta-lactamase regulating signal transducer with metallopeptidase domain
MTALGMDATFLALLGLGARGLLLLAIAAGVVAAMRRAPAAARHWVWFVAVAGLLALPAAAAMGPRWVVPVPAAMAARLAPLASFLAGDGGRVWANASAAEAAGPIVVHGALDTPTVGSGGEGGEETSPAAARGGSVAGLLLGLWAVGAALLLLMLALGHRTVRRFERRSRTFPAGRATALLDELRREMGIRRSVRVLRGPRDAMPMSWGALRPVILLPSAAEQWGGTRLRSVLLHELAHVRRRDCLTQTVAEIAVALHWPNPLAWLAARRLRVEREHACDDVVVLAGARPSEYALELIDLAGGFRPRGASTRVAAAMARPVELHGRLRAILEDGRARGGSWSRNVAAAALFAGCVLATAAFTPGAAGPAVETRTTAPASGTLTAGPAPDAVKGSVGRPVARTGAAAPDVSAETRAGADAPASSAVGPASDLDGDAPAGAAAGTAELPPRPRLPLLPVATIEPVVLADPAAVIPMEIAVIRGRVLDAVTGEPLADARLRLTGTSLVAVSAATGTYVLLNVPGGTHELVVERDGYAPQSRQVAVTEDAELETDFSLLPETAAPTDRAGAPMPARDVLDTLGVRIRRGGAAGPAPILFIDGVRIMRSEGVLDGLDPEGIQRVEIISGPAATTLYGPEAAGGVIQVFLKEGASTRIRLRDTLPVPDTLRPPPPPGP